MDVEAVMALVDPAVVGSLGAALSVVGTGLYLRGIRRGDTLPHRGSWMVWSVIAVVAAASDGADGGGWSLVVLGVQAVGTLAVAAWALGHGVGRLTPTNLAMLALAALGVLGWTTLTDPTVAAACVAVADGAGLVAMMPKTWADPYSETVSTYALAGVTGLLGALAVHAWSAALLFPVYFCLGNATTAVAITLRRGSVRELADKGVEATGHAGELVGRLGGVGCAGGGLGCSGRHRGDGVRDAGGALGGLVDAAAHLGGRG